MRMRRKGSDPTSLSSFQQQLSFDWAAAPHDGQPRPVHLPFRPIDSVRLPSHPISILHPIRLVSCPSLHPILCRTVSQAQPTDMHLGHAAVVPPQLAV